MHHTLANVHKYYNYKIAFQHFWMPKTEYSDMHVCSISAADGDDSQSSVSVSHLCSTEAEPDGGARDETQGKGSTSQSSYEISDALPQEYAAVGANLPINDESDTNRKRKPAEGSVSLCILYWCNLVYM